MLHHFPAQKEGERAHMDWTSVRVSLVIGLGVLLLGAFLLVKKPIRHQTRVTAYFANAMSLRPGAPVRLAGVDIGSVESVRARPELKEAPAEVVMVLGPSYELNLPSDSTALLETDGLLGQTYVDIDVAHSSGAPIGSNAVLKTLATPRLTTQEIFEKFSEVLSNKHDRESGKKNNAAKGTAQKNAAQSDSAFNEPTPDKRK